jgi:hypothetical protein
LSAEHALLLPPTRPVDAALETAELSMRITHPSPKSGVHTKHNPLPSGSRSIPYLGAHPDTPPCWVYNGNPGRGMLYVSNTPSTPSAEVMETLMGFRIGDTAASGLSALQRV